MILLIACNARFSHAAFALKTLRANLPPKLHECSGILEFTIQNDPTEAAYEILKNSPKIIGLSVYLWNIVFFRQLTEIIKRTHPEICIIIGGPEIAMPQSRMDDPLFKLADYIILGEGERALPAICTKVLFSISQAESGYPEFTGKLDQKILVAPKPDIEKLVLPYDEYTDDDIAHRILYVETSRGCPYRCAFCISSLDKPLRYFPIDALFEAFRKLIDRGAKAFKFLDRTLNASLPRALQILEFFMPWRDQVALHFEMVPHEIPDKLIEAMAKYPPGAIQIEFGVQTLTPEVAQTIHRRLDAERLLHNLAILREKTGVHIHADLIAGLPGESFEQFAQGFDRLYHSGVQEIQLGILKRLKSSPLDLMAEEWGLIFSELPPYEILQTPQMTFAELTEFKRFAKFYDTLVNNANFPNTVRAICEPDFFPNFHRLTQWIYTQTQATQGISQTRWVQLLFKYMTETGQFTPQDAAKHIIGDYLSSRKEDIPPILRPYLPSDFKISDYKRSSHKDASHIRQEKHLELNS
ncbi:MAG: DUF4080 domain-containing protein [Proteobacteria bacterium]|nr:DUF4080 domain-containing protein [Pseudomonadota bacterium]